MLSAYRQAGGVKVPEPTVMATPCAAGNRETWATPAANFPSEDHTAVVATPVNAVVKSATEIEDENALPWHPDDEYASKVLFDVISSRKRPIEFRERRPTIRAHAVHLFPTSVRRNAAEELQPFQ